MNFRPIEDIQAEIDKKLNLGLKDTSTMALYSTTSPGDSKGTVMIANDDIKRVIGQESNGVLYLFDGTGPQSGTISLKKYGS